MVKFHLSTNRSLCLEACTFGHRQFPATASWITCCHLLIESADGSDSPWLVLWPLQWLCHLANLLKIVQLPLNQGCDPYDTRGQHEIKTVLFQRDNYNGQTFGINSVSFSDELNKYGHIKSYRQVTNKRKLLLMILKHTMCFWCGRPILCDPLQDSSVKCM